MAEISVEDFRKLKKPKQNKYRNVKKTLDGKTFDSMKEYRRWIQLSAMQEAGEIEDLEHQKKYDIVIDFKKICSYYADFYYWKCGHVVEDVKSEITRKNPVYRLKKKLMKAVLGIDIVEV